MFENIFKFVFGLHQYLTGFAAFIRANNTGNFQLVGYSSGTIITDGEFSLNHRSRALLSSHNHARSLFEQGIAFAHIDG